MKLIFLDIDGTLTEPGKNTPPDSAVKAIELARKAGNKVFLCTGRNYNMLSPLLAYGFDGLVGSSGGYVEVEGKAIYDCPMTPEQTEKAMKVMADNHIFRTVECKDGSFTDDGLKDFLRDNKGSGDNSELLRWREQLEKSLGIKSMSDYSGQPIYKIVMMALAAEDLTNAQSQLDDSFGFCIQGSNGGTIFNGELICSEYDKGKGVRRVCEYLNCPIEDTYGFGDSMNDLEMMQTVGTAVCMDNGSEELKAMADYVCPAVSENGMYKAFEKYGLF